MGADVSEAEEASDEIMAAIAAGGTYSFVPEPDEDESVLPGEEELAADEVAQALLAAEPIVAEETEEVQPRATRPRSRKAAGEPEAAVAEAGRGRGRDRTAGGGGEASRDRRGLTTAR